MKTNNILCVVFLTLTAALSAQKADKLSFEVASIKATPPPTDGRLEISFSGDPGRLDWKGIPLKMILARAYEVKDFQISGPDFIEGSRFDVTAKIPLGASQGEVPAMLRTLLEERFKLVAHRETKDANVYGITIAKGGLKLKVADGDGANAGQVRVRPGRLELNGVPISQLAQILSRMLNRPVVDQTETKDVYNIQLEFTPEPGMGRGMGMAPPPPGAGGPQGHAEGTSTDKEPGSIFTALQEQCGLKLEAKKAPVEMVVVDRMEKTPTEN